MMRVASVLCVCWLLSAQGLAQESPRLPTAETRPAEPTLTPPPQPAPPVEKYVEEVKKLLEKPAPGVEPEKPAAPRAAPAAAPLSLQRELLWEEDYEEWQRRRTLEKRPHRLEGGVADAHVVQPGDTLWDLSSRYMGSPWLWPRVWSYNPHITNPHWIYPGQVIRFKPPGAPAAADEGVISALAGRPPAKVIPGHWGVKVFRHTAFVTKEELKALGTIENSLEDHQLLAPVAEVYLRFKEVEDPKTGKKAPPAVRVGDRFLSVRVGREVKHPVTGEVMGNLVHVTGEVKVTVAGSDRRFFTGTLVKAWRSVERTNLLLPWEELEAKIERVPNKKNLRGYIIASVQETLLGQYHLGFVDLGSKHGVEFGNVFRVLRQGDGFLRVEEYEGNRDKLPVEEIGQLIVLKVKPDTCTGVFRKTSIEVEIGDKVEMRQGE